MDLTKILGVNPGTCEVKAVKFKKNHFVKSYIQNMVYGCFKINIEIMHWTHFNKEVQYNR